MSLPLPADRCFAPFAGAGRKPDALVPFSVLGPWLEYRGLLHSAKQYFSARSRSGCSVLISLKIFQCGAKITGKLFEGRQRAPGLENFALSRVTPFSRKKIVVL